MGGGSPVARSHAAAAPRWATTRATAAPMATAIVHVRASVQLTSPATGFSGGSSCFVVRHVITATCRTATAASVPDAAATPCQASRFLFGMSWLCPERAEVNRASTKQQVDHDGEHHRQQQRDQDHREAARRSAERSHLHVPPDLHCAVLPTSSTE